MLMITRLRINQIINNDDIYIYINFHYYYDLLIMLILHKYIYI